MKLENIIKSLILNEDLAKFPLIQQSLQQEKMNYKKKYSNIVEFKLQKLTEYQIIMMQNLQFNIDVVPKNVIKDTADKQSINDLIKQTVQLEKFNKLIQMYKDQYDDSEGNKEMQQKKIHFVGFYAKKQNELFQEQRKKINEIRHQLLKSREALQIKEYEEVQKKKLKKHESCNQRLMSAFGLVGKVIHKPQYLKTTCVYNEKSCCTQQHIDSVMPFLEDNLSKIDKKIDLIEMFLLQFRGNEFLYAVQIIFKDEKARHTIQKRISQMNMTYQQFRTDYLFENLRESQNLLDRLQNVRNHVREKAYNVVCAICNPNDNNYFAATSDSGLKVYYHENNCYTFFERVKFEFDLIDFYQNFVSIIAKAILSKSNKSQKTLFPLNYKMILEEKERYEGCYQYKNMNDIECQKLCKKIHLFSFKFRYDFLEALKMAQDVIFKNINKYEFDEMLQSISFDNVVQTVTNERVYLFDRYNPLFMKGNFQRNDLILQDSNALIYRNDIMKHIHTKKNSIVLFVCFFIASLPVLFNQ